MYTPITSIPNPMSHLTNTPENIPLFPSFMSWFLTCLFCFESPSPIGGACWNTHWWPVFWLAWACGSFLQRVTAAMGSWVELLLPAQERAFHSSPPHSPALALCSPPSSTSLSLVELMWMSCLRAEPLRVPYLSILSGCCPLQEEASLANIKTSTTTTKPVYLRMTWL